MTSMTSHNHIHQLALEAVCSIALITAITLWLVYINSNRDEQSSQPAITEGHKSIILDDAKQWEIQYRVVDKQCRLPLINNHGKPEITVLKRTITETRHMKDTGLQSRTLKHESTHQRYTLSDDGSTLTIHLDFDHKEINYHLSISDGVLSKSSASHSIKAHQS